MSHEPNENIRIVHKYGVDALGAPFKVSVVDAVSVRTNPITGKEMIQIPDLVGLINVVVRTRVLDERKLNGKELKFLRNAIGVRAKTLAEFLDMTPAHLSRCEGSQKTMAATSEKLFRLFVYFATYMDDPQKAMEEVRDLEIKKTSEEPEQLARTFIGKFLAMRIRPVFDSNEELHYEFERVPNIEKWSPSLAA